MSQTSSNPTRSSPATASDVAVIEPEALFAEINGPGPAPLLLQATSAEVFAQAHLPGAQLVTPAELVCGIAPATGKLPALPDLQRLFTRLAYHPALDIVVYDDEGGGWAGRLAWTLDVIAHRRWRYLNGGLQAWHAAGLPLLQHGKQGHQGPASAIPGTADQVNIEIDSRPIAEMADVLAAIDDPNQVIWDVRSIEEYRGQRQAAARSGHIPGAVHMDWLELKDPQQQQRIRDNIGLHLQPLGLAGKKIITHCQTHHRSGLSYMLGRLLGYDIRAYHGSWSEWGNREDTPIEV